MVRIRTNEEIMLFDPKTSLIGKRLAGIENLISVASGKGGVGKSLITATLALLLSERGQRVGLLDLDIYGPSLHLILGSENLRPREEKGIIPPKVHGVKFMSTNFFTRDQPVFLRGKEVSDSIREILALTRWGPLDYLLIDMPPGTGEETLDVIGLLEKSEFLVVCTPSRMALETVKRLLKMLKELGVPIIGVIENMRNDWHASAEKQMSEFGAPFLGGVRYDRNVEDAIGDVKKLLKTEFSKDVRNLLTNL